MIHISCMHISYIYFTSYHVYGMNTYIYNTYLHLFMCIYIYLLNMYSILLKHVCMFKNVFIHISQCADFGSPYCDIFMGCRGCATAIPMGCEACWSVWVVTGSFKMLYVILKGLHTKSLHASENVQICPRKMIVRQRAYLHRRLTHVISHDFTTRTLNWRAGDLVPLDNWSLAGSELGFPWVPGNQCIYSHIYTCVYIYILCNNQHKDRFKEKSPRK